MLSIFETQDGSHTLYSDDFRTAFHSIYGAVQESRHVFIEAGLFYKSIVKKKLAILEIGFGTGLNALLTFSEAEKLNLEIAYTTIEAYPVGWDIAKQLNYPQKLDNEQLVPIFDKMHNSPWGQPVPLSDSFMLEKWRQDFLEANYPQQFDLIYFDAFSPDMQPEFWERPLLQKMFDALLPGGVLVTYCAKGAFKRALKSVGFQVEGIKGPPGKREMTRGQRIEN